MKRTGTVAVVLLVAGMASVRLLFIILTVCTVITGCSMEAPMPTPPQYQGEWKLMEYKVPGKWQVIKIYPNSSECLKERDRIENTTQRIMDCDNH